MKLKKIAALALAGVMAVSMLAGCAGKTGTTTEDGTKVETSSSAAATVFNDSQNPNNSAKVTFSSSSVLDSALEKAAKSVGTKDGFTYAEALNAVYNATGIVKGTTANDGYDVKADFYNDNGKKGTVDVKNGTSVTRLYVYAYTSAANNVWSETAAIQKAADLADNEIKDLAKDTYKSGTTTEKYFKYTYTGDAGAVTVEKLDGSKVYIVAFTITQTAAETPVA